MSSRPSSSALLRTFFVALLFAFSVLGGSAESVSARVHGGKSHVAGAVSSSRSTSARTRSVSRSSGTKAPGTILCVPDLALSLTHSNDPCPGDVAHERVAVRNVGSGPSVGAITVTDTLPDGLDFVGASGSGWTIATSGRVLTATYSGVIAIGQSVGFDLDLAVAESAAPGLTHTLRLSGGGDSSSSGNQVTDLLTLCGGPDLTITKSHLGDFASGSLGAWRLVVRNVGNLPTTGTITVTDTLPSSVTWMGGSGSGWTIGKSGRVVTARHPSPLAPGDSLVLTLTAKPGSASVPGVTNCASVSTPGDTRTDDDRSCDATPVLSGFPDLSILLIRKNAPCVGDTVWYHAPIRNAGTGPCLGPITVVDTLPAGLTFGRVAGDGWIASLDGHVLTLVHAGPLAAGDTLGFTLGLLVGPEALPSVTNIVYVYGAGDSHASNDRSNDTLTPCPGPATPDLAVTLAALNAPCVGDTARFGVVVRNAGNASTVGAITVTDTLPAGLTFAGATGSGWTFVANGAVVTATYGGTLAPGANAGFTLLALVGPAATPSVINTVTVSGGGDASSANDRASVTITPCPQPGAPDLRIQLHGEDVPCSSDTASVFATVSNVGDAPSFGAITVTDTLPAGLAFVQGTGSGWTFAVNGAVVTATFTGTLAPGASAGFTLVTLVGPAAYPSVTTSATVSGGGDTTPANDRATLTLPICPPPTHPDLALGMTALNAPCVGDTAIFRVLVRNVGSAPTVGSFFVTDSLGAGLTFVSASGSGFTFTPADPFVTAQYAAALAPGDSAVFTLRALVGAAAYPSAGVFAVVSGGGDFTSANNHASVTITPCSEPTKPDLAIDKRHAGAFVVGTNGTYTIVVTNVGTAPTTGTITVTDTLPAGLAFVSGAGAGWTISNVAGAVIATHASPLAVGDSLSFTLTVAVNASAVPGVVNAATVNTPGDDNPANDRDTDPTPVSPTTTPDLALGMSALNAPCVGDTAIFGLVVRNIGSAGTPGTITVRDTLPAGLTYAGGFDASWTVTVSGNVVTATHAPLAAGDSLLVTLRAVVGAAAYPSVTNSATVSTSGDANVANDRASVTITPCPAPTHPDLAIDKHHVGDFVVPGPGQYEIVVTNVGTAPTTGTITVTDTLPSPLSFFAVQPSGWSVTHVGQVVTATHPSPLAPGDSLSFVLRVLIDPSAAPQVTNAATVSTPGDDNPANDRDTDTVPVTYVTAPDLQVSLTQLNAPCVGDTASLGVFVRNAGNAPTVGTITVTDTLPAGLTLLDASGTGWSFTLAGNVLVATFDGVLAPDANAGFTLRAIVGPAAYPAVTDSVHVSGGGDTNGGGDVATLTIHPCPAPAHPDLTIDKRHAASFVVGSNGTYTIVVTNVGTAPTTGTITVRDTLPAGLAFVSGAGSGWTIGADGALVTATHASPLAVGDSLSFTLTVAVSAQAAPSVTNAATVNTPGDENPANDRDTDPTPVSPLAKPDLTIDKRHAADFVVDHTGTYTIVVTNVGTAATTGTFTVRDTLPAGLGFVSGSGAGWSFGSNDAIVTATHTGVLAAGDSTHFTLTVTVSAAAVPSVTNAATVSGGGDDTPDNDRDTDPTPVTPTPTPDLALVMTALNAPCVGDTAVFSLVVRNVGAAPTSSLIALTDSLPAGLHFAGSSGPGWNVIVANEVVTATRVAPLAAGDSLVLTLRAVVGAAAYPSVTNRATVSTAGDAVTANDRASVTLTPCPAPAKPDLAIDKRHTGTFSVGSNGTYTIVVTNVGTAPTTGTITVRDTLPAGLAFVSGAGSGWTIGANGALVTATHASPLAVGDSLSFTLTVAIGAQAAPSVTNAATVNTPGDDNPVNDRDVDPTTIVTSNVPDLTIDKRHAANFVVGSNGTYTIVVTNVGTAPTTGTITVRDTLPAGLTYVSGAGNGWTISNATGVVLATHPSPLAVGDSLSFTLTVAVGASAVPSVTNAANVSGGGDDTPGNNRDTDLTPVQLPSNAPDLAIDKRHTEDFVVGQPATWTIVVTNVGTAPTTGTITVRDTLSYAVSLAGVAGTGWQFTTTPPFVVATHAAPLAPGDSLKFTLTVVPAREAAPRVSNAASVNTPGDTNPANDRDVDPVPVSLVPLVPDLAIEKSHKGDFSTGHTGSYVIVVRNVGGVASTGTITVRDTMPAGLSIIRAEGQWNYANYGDRIVATTDAVLQPGEAMTLTVFVNVGPQAVPSVINWATVSGGGDTTPTNNRDDDPTNVNGVGRLVLDKQVSPEAVEVGDLVDYRITMRNVGNGLMRDVRVDDRLPLGITYVPGTARVDGVRIADPTVTDGSTLHFSVGDLDGGQTRVLAYRCEVRAGAELGDGDNLASAHPLDDPGVVSNISHAKVRVRSLTMPDEGIIVGKVFVDCDCDSDGVQRAEELGIPGVRVYLEDGTSAITDAEGKYSFPNVRPRLHAVRVDAGTLPPAVSLKPVANAHLRDGLSRFVDLTKGELHRADFVARTCDPVALAQVKARRAAGEIHGPDFTPQPGAVSGSALQALSRAPSAMVLLGAIEARLDRRSLRNAELCGPTRDAFGDRLRDASFSDDEGRTFGAARAALFAKGPVGAGTTLTLRYDSERDPAQRRFRDLRPQEGFDTFGDASVHEFDARSTSRLFARLDRGSSYALFGDFTTPASELFQLGAFTRSLNGGVAHVESKLASVSGFGTQARERQVVDEIPARGVSGPYALSHADGVVGSEVVEVIVRDRNQPSRVLSRERRERFVDYSIEPFTGRLLFRQPVASVDENLNPVSIRVLYEVSSAGDAYGIYGGDVTLTPLPRVTLGVSAARDEDPAASHALSSASLALRPLDGLSIRGEVAHSDSGGAFFDGARQGDAWRGDVRLDRGRLGAGAFAQRSERAFDNASSGILPGREELGADAKLSLGASWLGARALRTTDLANGGRRDGVDASIGRRFGVLGAEAGWRWAHETDAPATAAMNGLTPNDVSALRGKLSAELPGARQKSLFAEVEHDVQHDSGERVAFGADVHVTPGVRAYARHENLGSLAGPFAINDAQQQAATVVGLSSDEQRDRWVFSEYRSRDAFAGRDLQAAMGLRERWRLQPGLRVDGSLEHVEVIRGGRGNSTSATSGLEWTRDPRTKATARLEFHRQSKADQWLASGSLARKFSRDWTGLAQSTWFRSPDEQRTDELTRLGLAWRQTDRNVWDALARYEHRVRHDGSGADALDDRTHVIASDLNWHPTRAWTVGGQAAARWLSSDAAGRVTHTDAQLLAARALVDLTSRLDAGVIARGLFSDHFDARQTGLGAELGVLVVRDVRVAAGYNVFGLRHDALTHETCTDQGPYVRLGLKLGEGWFGRSRSRSRTEDAPLGFEPVAANPDAPAAAVTTPVTALTPLRQRTTDQQIARDLASIDAAEARLGTLSGAANDPWRAAAARSWLDAARTEYTDDDETGFAEGAYALGTSLLDAIANGAVPAGPGTVPPLTLPERTPRVRDDLWRWLDQMKGSPGFSCAAEDLARMEVELAYAGNESVDQGDCEEAPHVASAERYGHSAADKIAGCTPKPEPPAEPKPKPEEPVVVPPVVPPVTPEVAPRIPRDVHFAFDRCDLSAKSKEVVRQVADALKRVPSLKVRLDGFTDVRGTSRYNRGLAACRVCSVASYFEQLGIDASRVESNPRGAEDFVSNERSREGHALNRRVEMTLVDATGHPLPADSQREDLRIEPKYVPGQHVPKAAAPAFPVEREGQCSR